MQITALHNRKKIVVSAKNVQTELFKQKNRLNISLGTSDEDGFQICFCKKFLVLALRRENRLSLSVNQRELPLKL